MYRNHLAQNVRSNALALYCSFVPTHMFLVQHNQPVPNAVYTHCYDPTFTRLFVGTSPSAPLVSSFNAHHSSG
jgi:hypothetical protein